MSKTYTLTEEQLQFICHMASMADNIPSLRERVDKSIKSINYKSEISLKSNNSLDNLRKEHNPAKTAEFLSLFGSPSGLKFLTHDFDPDSGQNIKSIIEQSVNLIYKYKLPKSLYALMSGFIKGPKWIDYDGNPHYVYLCSQSLQEWCARYPTLHPITSSEFGNDVQCFRNTVRLSKPDFPKRLSALIEKNRLLQGLRIQTEGLDRVDFYTNVAYLFQYILKRVLFDIHKRDSSAEVQISYERTTWNEYRLHQLRIVHKDSEANPIDMVQDKLQSGGGDLFGLAESCVGYCDWSVEANFEGEKKRWRILNFRNLPEVEDLNEGKVDGFTHIFTFYKYK